MRPTANEPFGMGGGRSRKSTSVTGGDSFVFTAAPASSGGNMGVSASSVEELQAAGASSMRYFIANEATVNAATMTSSSTSLGSAGRFGVHSLSSSEIESSAESRASSKSGQRRVSAGSVDNKSDSREGVENEPESTPGDEVRVGFDDGHEDEVHATPNSNSRDNHSGTDTHTITDTSIRGHMTQHLSLEPPDSPFLGTLKSPRSCDDFSEATSQAVISGGEDDDGILASPPPSSAASPSPRQRGKRRISPSDTMMSPPQFIMPTIKMPSRRPFTERGKRIGRLKILIAGDSGIGKTSLIKSIVQSCGDIVHVDPVPNDPGARRNSRNSMASTSYYTLSSRELSDATKEIFEIYASTKPYPHWWSEHEDSKILRRRKSSGVSGDIVLERNLCFVDTPGYGSGTSFADCVEPVVQYVEGQMERTALLLNNGEGDLLSLLSGNGTPQVDVVFYVILHRLKPVDIEYIRRLSPLTSILPVIAKADSLTPQQIKALKLSILSDLRGAGIKPFLFGKEYEDIRDGTSEPCAPFAISSAISSDHENMDASVLMSPDYSPPLVDIELGELIRHVFEPDNIAWLKHAAAKKYIKWVSQTMNSSFRGSLPPPQPASACSPQRSLNSSALNSPSSLISPPPSFTLARVADHTQREERFAQARLARWANDLQRSLRAERERYGQLAKGERAIWLTERLNECIIDGQLVTVSTALVKSRSEGVFNGRTQGKTPEDWGGFSAKDPLRVLESLQNLSRGASLLGYGGSILAVVTALWALKNYGMTLGDFAEWIGFRMK